MRLISVAFGWWLERTSEFPAPSQAGTCPIMKRIALASLTCRLPGQKAVELELRAAPGHDLLRIPLGTTLSLMVDYSLAALRYGRMGASLPKKGTPILQKV